VNGGITAARALRGQLLAGRSRGEAVESNARLRFTDAAAKWHEGPVQDLRPRTEECYRNAVEGHLIPRLGARRLDAISPDDLAELVRDEREAGLSESTIAIVLGVLNRIYRYAARRLGWRGINPVSLMLSSERPKPSNGRRRRIFEGKELEQTIAAANEPYRTLFILAALTGARGSELLGLTWADVRLGDADDAEIEFAWQVDRQGQRGPTKTDGSARTVPIPRELARVLASHKLASRFSRSGDYVFATRTGGPLGQRNICRALRDAQRAAVDENGRPTFPMLHEVDESGRPVAIPVGALPSMTRAVYVSELADARRRSMRRSRMIAEFGELFES